LVQIQVIGTQPASGADLIIRTRSPPGKVGPLENCSKRSNGLAATLARMKRFGYPTAAYLLIASGYSQKDICPHCGCFLIFSHYTILVCLRAWLSCSEQFGSYIRTTLLRNSNSLLGTDIFCSKTSCRKLPVHSHSSPDHHVFLTEEGLSGQAPSHEILNIVSPFPGQKHCKRVCSCLMLV